MVIGESGKGIFQPLLDLKTNRVLFFLVKMGAGLLLGLLLIFYRPIIETRFTHITHPEAGAETIPARPQDLASREDIVLPDAGAKSPQVSLSSDEIVSKATSDSAINPPCGEQCQIARRLINHMVNLSDEEAEALLSNAHRLANAIRQNAELRSGLLQIATTLTGAQRQLLINAFYFLEPEYRRSLGVVLDRSPHPIQRLDGIQLMASANVMDTSIVNRLIDRVLEETDVHVREALVRALNQPELLRGNPRVLQALQQMQSTEQVDAVRGQALLARVGLSVNSEPFIEDAIAAIRSGQDAYAADGALALERILVQVSRDEAKVSIDNQAAVHQLMEDLMTSESMTAIPRALRVSLDDLYVRFF